MNFTPEAQHFIYQQKQQGRKVWAGNLQDSIAPRCSNCGDSQSIFLEISKSGPFPIITGNAVKWRDDGYYECETRVFPCPDCGEETREAKVSALLRMSGLEPAEWDWSIDYIKDTPGRKFAYMAASQIAQQSIPTGVYSLYGWVGLGKTGLMKSLVAHFCKKGIRAQYVHLSTILEEARRTFTDDSGKEHLSESAVKKWYSSAQLLCIDELDKVKLTGWARGFVMPFLDGFYTARETKALITATNSESGKMGTDWAYWESRAKDGKIIIFGGDDMRGRK